jgi:predicted nucleotidyltransferase
VLPYILTALKNKIEEITPVEKIFLFGSRSRVPFEKWKELEGKDWDILVQTKFKLRNAYVLVDENYHLDLLVLDEERIKKYYSNNLTMIFPENELIINN